MLARVARGATLDDRTQLRDAGCVRGLACASAVLLAGDEHDVVDERAALERDEGPHEQRMTAEREVGLVVARAETRARAAREQDRRRRHAGAGAVAASSSSSAARSPVERAVGCGDGRRARIRTRDAAPGRAQHRHVVLRVADASTSSSGTPSIAVTDGEARRLVRCRRVPLEEARVRPLDTCEVRPELAQVPLRLLGDHREHLDDPAPLASGDGRQRLTEQRQHVVRRRDLVADEAAVLEVDGVGKRAVRAASRRPHRRAQHRAGARRGASRPAR
jgi:hypothetical protein